MNSNTTIHAFNTGRLYSDHGQRIAWVVLSTGHVAMYDLDRYLDYVLIVEHPTNARVLAAYDAIAQAPFNQAEREEARGWHERLTAAARPAKLPEVP